MKIVLKTSSVPLNRTYITVRLGATLNQKQKWKLSPSNEGLSKDLMTFARPSGCTQWIWFCFMRLRNLQRSGRNRSFLQNSQAEEDLREEAGRGKTGDRHKDEDEQPGKQTQREPPQELLKGDRVKPLMTAGEKSWPPMEHLPCQSDNKAAAGPPVTSSAARTTKTKIELCLTEHCY